MTEIKEIHNALQRLSCIGSKQFQFDQYGQIFGNGEIHYLVEVRGLFFVAWEDHDEKKMIVNPITRFELDELIEVGIEEAWMVVSVPAELHEGIQFNEIDSQQLIESYHVTEEWAIRYWSAH